MNWFLGTRYDVLMKCARHGGRFTAHELGIPGMTMKGLADDGYLKIVEKRCKRLDRPYSYVVTDAVRDKFIDGCVE